MVKKRSRGKNLTLVLVAIALMFIASLVLAILLVGLLGEMEKYPIGDVALIIAILDPTVAAVGLCLVIVQLHLDGEGDEHGRLVEQQRFLLEYNKVFIENERMMEVESLLERYDEGKVGDADLLTDENKQSFVNYLVYLEGFAPLVLDEVIELNVLDDLMAYRFYLAVNNPVLQDKEIKPFAAYYLGIIRLYRKWTDYRNKRGLPILRGESSPLDGWDEYEHWHELAVKSKEVDDD